MSCPAIIPPISPRRSENKSSWDFHVEPIASYPHSDQYESGYSLDIEKLVNDYNTNMNAKQKSYQLTSKDKSDKAKIERYRVQAA